MPFSTALVENRVLSHTRKLRQNRIAGYGSAFVTVALAALARVPIGDLVAEGLLFSTFYPAIIITALIGGFRPGILAVLLSLAAVWVFFMPPGLGLAFDQATLAALSVFTFLGVIDVVIITFLNRAIDGVLAQQQSIKLLIESAPNGILVVDEEGTIKLINTSMEEAFGYKRSELLGQRVELLLPAQMASAHPSLREAFMLRPQARLMGTGRDLSGKRKDGTEFPVEVGLNPLAQNGKRSVMATVIDISERKRAQERQTFLVRELQHRARNLITVVHAIAIRTLAENQTLIEAKADLSGRLHALGRAYAMLTDSQWQGASLDKLIAQEVAAFTKPLAVTGCDIVLSPTATQQFALIVHELATNAAKHGSLSVPEGLVSVEGTIEQQGGEPLFIFRWLERDGPLVSEPLRKGLGSAILIEHARQFGESVEMQFAKEGLRYELKVRLAAIEASKSMASPDGGADLYELRA